MPLWNLVLVKVSECVDLLALALVCVCPVCVCVLEARLCVCVSLLARACSSPQKQKGESTCSDIDRPGNDGGDPSYQLVSLATHTITLSLTSWRSRSR